MKRTLAVILAGGEGARLSILSEKRAKPAVPFGGKFRIIDFALSNCVNSDIDNVAVLTQYNPRSLSDHIGSGRPWDLDRNRRRDPHPAAVHRARQDQRVVPRHRGRRPPEHVGGGPGARRRRPRPGRRPRLQDGLLAVRRLPPPAPGRRHDRRPPRAARRGESDGDPGDGRDGPDHRVPGEAEAAEVRPRQHGRLRLQQAGASTAGSTRATPTSAAT